MYQSRIEAINNEEEYKVISSSILPPPNISEDNEAPYLVVDRSVTDYRPTLK